MLDLAAFSIVFLIVTLAVPYTAAGIIGGTVGLALSHAFEAAYVAQTVVRPITTALHTGFNKVAQIGNGSGDTDGPATGWVKSTDFGRQTQQLANLGSGGGQRVTAPKDVRGCRDALNDRKLKIWHETGASGRIEQSFGHAAPDPEDCLRVEVWQSSSGRANP
jgi:hypothetical protein